LTPFVGAVAVVTAQAIAHTPEGPSMIDLSQFSRTAVIVTLFLISAGAMAAVTSLVRRRASSSASDDWPGHQRSAHRDVLAL